MKTSDGIWSEEYLLSIHYFSEYKILAPPGSAFEGKLLWDHMERFLVSKKLSDLCDGYGVDLRNYLYNEQGGFIGVSYWNDYGEDSSYCIQIMDDQKNIIKIYRPFSLMDYDKKLKKKIFDIAKEKNVDMSHYKEMDGEPLQFLEDETADLFEGTRKDILHKDARLAKQFDELEKCIVRAKRVE